MANRKGRKGNFGNPEQHRKAGKAGGEAVSRDRQHMAEIGRVGGSH
jgi:general stress protein YciG